MIPFAVPAVLKTIPWRLVGAVALVVAVAVMGWRVSVWHDSHRKLKATEKALETRTAEAQQCAARELVAAQAYREAAGKAKAREAEDRATAERIEHDLQTKLADADARGRDLARRLRHASRAACAGSGAVPGAAAAAGQPAQPAGEPGDGDAVEIATAEHLSACERDATRLAGWQEWWAGVRR